MAQTERHDSRHMWHPDCSGPHFAPLDDQRHDPATASTPARMPTLGAFMLADFTTKTKTALLPVLLPWVCVFRSHDYPESLSPTYCRRCGRSSTFDQGD